jgi:DNA-binding NtrC family response regulator
MSISEAKNQESVKEKSVLEQLLEVNGLDLNGLSEYLGIGRTTLWQYRVGRREFRLNMQQISKLDSLLQKMGKRLSDLPPDWILDKN